MLVDLHCHTTASDGALPPDRLIDRAIANGVDLLSITDHDTFEAYRHSAPHPNLELITGIEFSCQWEKLGIHIVGLNLDPAAPAMVEAVSHQTRARNERAGMIAEKLEKYGVESPLAGALALAGDGSLGRPHFARHLADTGFVKSVDEAFRKYLGTGKPCDIRVCWPTPDTVIDWIRDAGGVAILAHPGKYQFTRQRLSRCVEYFAQAGGQGLEVVSGRQLPAETRLFASLCETFDLCESLGSDFHSPAQHWLDLGRYSTPPALRKPVWELWR